MIKSEKEKMSIDLSRNITDRLRAGHQKIGPTVNRTLLAIYNMPETIREQTLKDISDRIAALSASADQTTSIYEKVGIQRDIDYYYMLKSIITNEVIQ